MSGLKEKIKKIPSWIVSILATRSPLFIKRPLRAVYRYARGAKIRKILAQHRAMLQAILRQVDCSKPVIIFAPSLDWNVQLFQRPQQLALALARQGATVFYVQPQPDLSKPPYFQFSDGLFFCNVFVETFKILESPFVYVLTWNSGHLRSFTTPKIIYDYVDDVDVFYGNHEEIVANHKQMTREAHFILATAQKLYDEVSCQRKDVIFSPNGVDLNHFQTSPQPIIPPDDLKPILEKNRPVIGYYGALARWFDYDLMKRLADLRPDYSFVLIGPDYDGTLKPAGLLDTPNVFWLGVKSYQELPNYLHFFDVATIPFIVNEITHAVSPLKLFEYMAGGKPVVVTPMRESMRHPGVLVGDTPEEFARQLDKALEISKDPGYIAVVHDVANHNTWDTRARELIDRIQTAEQ